ncbi:MAG: hypothetical protein ACOYON_15350, partial [Fimbriimonas sp.]
MASRRFTEKEATALLRKAAELQASGTDSSAGISLDELRAAASEIGISPQTFAAAIEQYDTPEVPAKVGLFGGPSKFVHEQVVEGTLTEDGWEEILTDLRRTFGDQGTVNVRGNTREWMGHGGGLAEVTFSARQVGGSVRFSASSSLDGFAAMIYVIGTIPLLMGLGLAVKFLALGNIPNIAMAVCWLFLGMYGMRALFSRACVDYRAKWASLLSRSLGRVV